MPIRSSSKPSATCRESKAVRHRIAVGEYGAGPFEFRRISGMFEDGSGQIVVYDRDLSRVSVFTDQLEPVTSYKVESSLYGSIHLSDDGMVSLTRPTSRTVAMVFLDHDWEPEWRVPVQTPPINKYPYWASYAGTLLTSSSSEIIRAYSFLYPLYIHDTSGALVDSISSRPPSFRVAPVLKPGALVGMGADERLAEWIDSFDMMTRMNVLADSLLIVTHDEGCSYWTITDGVR